MKTLVLCRHAKSDWSTGMLDFDRPLNHRGAGDAPKMGKILADWGFSPDLIVSSPAKRAITTANFFARALSYDESRIKKEDSIYEATPGTLLNLIESLPENAGSVMLFGHNSGMELTAASLMGMNGNFHLPTCGLVILESSLDWKLISQKGMSLKAFLIPRIFTGKED